jgi:hypothetical protein
MSILLSPNNSKSFRGGSDFLFHAAEKGGFDRRAGGGAPD